MRLAELHRYGLVTVADAAVLRGVAVMTIRRWVRSGTIRVVIVSDGPRQIWLLDRRELRAFVRPKLGRPPAKKRKAK